MAFAPLDHAIEPRLLDDPVVASITWRLHKTPAQILLAWAVRRGTELLTASANSNRIRANFDISMLTEDALKEFSNDITKHYRFNSVVETGIPGSIPRGR